MTRWLSVRTQQSFRNMFGIPCVAGSKFLTFMFRFYCTVIPTSGILFINYSFIIYKKKETTYKFSLPVRKYHKDNKGAGKHILERQLSILSRASNLAKEESQCAIFWYTTLSYRFPVKWLYNVLSLFCNKPSTCNTNSTVQKRQKRKIRCCRF